MYTEFKYVFMCKITADYRSIQNNLYQIIQYFVINQKK